MKEIAEMIPLIMSVLALLVFTTTIIVGVLKTFIKMPTNYLAIIVAMIITLTAYFAYVSYHKLPIYWYSVVGAFVAGIFVAYIAMFGFDKFKEAWEHTHNY